jgi:hypothetical protein
MERITRAEAIERLREALLELADESTSLCTTLAREGRLCGGLARWTPDELRARLAVAIGEDVDPERLLEVADRVQLRRQDLAAGRLPCDGASPGCGALCWGWDEFYEGELADFLRELGCGEVRVLDDARAGCF